MSERPIKQFYRPRVQIPVEMTENEPGEYGLFVLPMDGVSIILKLLEYAHRRIQYVDETIDAKSFYCPDDDTFDDILLLVNDTEARLMLDVRETLDTIAENIEALLCACTSLVALGETQDEITVINGVAPYVPNGDTLADIDAMPVPEVDTDACDLANVAYGFTFELLTERILPLAETLTDATALAITATTTFAALSGGLGLPVPIATAAFLAIVAFLVDGSIANLENWLYGNAQEIVCEIYTALVSYGSFAAAASAASDFIDAGEGISSGDKQMLKWLLGNRWFYQAMAYCVDATILNPTPYIGYSCATCEESPEIAWLLTGHEILYPEYVEIISNTYTEIVLQWIHDDSISDPVYCSLNGCFLHCVAPIDTAVLFTIEVLQGGVLPTYIFDSNEGSCTGRARFDDETTTSVKTFTVADPDKYLGPKPDKYIAKFEPMLMYSYGDTDDVWRVKITIGS